MHNSLALLLLIEASLFLLTMGLALNERTQIVGEYVGIAFHLLLMPVIVGFPIAQVGQAAGLLWIACDVIASTGNIWNSRTCSANSTSVFLPIRMAGHLFAALWIVYLSLQLPALGLAVGVALALGFAGYTLAGGRISQKALGGPALLLFAWLLLLARDVRQ